MAKKAMDLLDPKQIDKYCYGENSAGNILIQAVKKGRKEIVKNLIAKGVDLNEAGKSEKTAHKLASETGDEGMVELLATTPEIVNFSYTNRMNALTYAVEKGHEKVVALLFKKGAVFKDSGLGGKTTILMRAAQNGHKELVKFMVEKLIAEEVGVEERDVYKKTALMLAAEKNRPEIVEILIDCHETEEGKLINIREAFIAAIQSQSLAVMELLINKGIDVNAQDSLDNTLLHYALKTTKVLPIENLLTIENANLANKAGETNLNLFKFLPIIQNQELQNLHFMGASNKF
jgi:ankyrin repeat protein